MLLEQNELKIEWNDRQKLPNKARTKQYICLKTAGNFHPRALKLLTKL